MCGDKTNLPRATAQIEDRLAFTQILAGIAAAVVAVDDFLRNNFEVLSVVIDRATKLRFRRLRSGSIAFPDFGFSVDRVYSLGCWQKVKLLVMERLNRRRVTGLRRRERTIARGKRDRVQAANAGGGIC